MRFLFCLPLFCAGVAAQVPGDADLTRLTRELRSAVGNDSLASAADLADKLDRAVQQRYQTWLIRDTDQRVNDVLTWLPPDIESLWVNQEPFTIKPDDSVELKFRRPIQAYSMDRLTAINGGIFHRALGNRAVRLVVSAARNLSADRDRVMIPALAGSQDVVYFYFFADPVDLPPADDSIQGRPAWRATAQILDFLHRQPRTEPPLKEDENWLVLARTDLLVLSNRREMLIQILDAMTGGSKARALPANLPEWGHVDRTASFWGLRHYSAQSKPRPEQRGFNAAELPLPDGAAIGATVRFDDAKQRLEILYLSEGPLSQIPVFAEDLRRNFQVDQPEAGVWRLISDVKTRGPYPIGFAMTMLGFGEYR